MLLQVLHDRVLNLLTNAASTGGSADSSLSSEIKWGLQCALNELCETVKPTGLRKDGSITLATSTKDYPLASDVSTLIDGSIKFSVAPYFTLERLHEAEYDQWQLDASVSTGEPRRYIQRGRDATTGYIKIRVWPTPTSTQHGKTIAYRYFRLPTDLYAANLSDAIDPGIDPTYLNWLPYGALVYLRNYARSQSDVNLWVAEWKAFLRRTRADEPEVVGETFQRHAYRPQGQLGGRVYPYSAGLSGP